MTLTKPLPTAKWISGLFHTEACRRVIYFCKINEKKQTQNISRYLRSSFRPCPKNVTMLLFLYFMLWCNNFQTFCRLFRYRGWLVSELQPPAINTAWSHRSTVQIFSGATGPGGQRTELPLQGKLKLSRALQSANRRVFSSRRQFRSCLCDESLFS